MSAPALTRDALVRSLLAGTFYSSSGPDIIGWGVRDGRVWVDCSPCERVSLIAGGPVNAGATVIAPEGDPLTHAEFTLSGHETYVRLECTDERGRTAWSNPVFAD